MFERGESIPMNGWSVISSVLVSTSVCNISVGSRFQLDSDRLVDYDALPYELEVAFGS